MVQENIKNKPEGFGTVALAFLEGGRICIGKING